MLNKKSIKELINFSNEEISRIIKDQNFISKIEFLYNMIAFNIANTQKIFFCANGGSAANADHIVNDFNLSIFKNNKNVVCESLTSNSAVLTCFANDFGYENIFSNQIDIKCDQNSLVIFMTGSGNSKNIIKGILRCIEKKINYFLIVGFDGGECKKISNSNNILHLQTNDMQACENVQLIIGHVLMQKLLNY